MKIITYINYTTNAIMQLKKDFGKFRITTELMKNMVCKWKGSFRGENPTFHLSYWINETYLYIFLISKIH